HASSFAMRNGKTGTIVHDGTFDGWGAACPSGTVFMGGGGYTVYGTAVQYSGPDWDPSTDALVPNSWITIDDGGVAVSFVTCYSPSGASIPGAVTSMSQVWNATNIAQHTEGVDASHYPSAASTAKVDSLKSGLAQPKR
ncbi:MAG TPA: hypothetical protein VFP34_17340, partial [Microlunatus sp.]|nr:hypothetical protein [Microlunatus sp.]